MSNRQIEVVNRIGRTVYSTNEPKLARKWIAANKGALGPLVIEEVTWVEQRRRLPTEEPQRLALVAS